MLRKYLMAVLMFAVLGAMAYAGDGRSELTGGASYSKPDGGSAAWSAGAEFSVPFGKYFRGGPALQIVNAAQDFQAFGGVLEIDFMGESGLFAACAGLYDPEAPEGADSHTVDCRGGFRQVVGGGGLIKVYLERTIDGYGESEDLRGAASFGVRFGKK